MTLASAARPLFALELPRALPSGRGLKRPARSEPEMDPWRTRPFHPRARPLGAVSRPIGAPAGVHGPAENRQRRNAHPNDRLQKCSPVGRVSLIVISSEFICPKGLACL